MGINGSNPDYRPDYQLERTSKADKESKIGNVMMADGKDQAPFGREQIEILQERFQNILKTHFRQSEYNSYLSDIALAGASTDLVTFETSSPECRDVIGRDYLPSMKRLWINTIAPVKRVTIKLSADVSRTLSANAARAQSKETQSSGFAQPSITPGVNQGKSPAFFKDISGSFSSGGKSTPTEKSTARNGKPVLGLKDLISPVDERNSFENFVVDASNEVAFAAARSAVSGVGAAELIYLYGKSGVGKTHLLHAITLEARRKNPAFKTAFLSYNNIESGCVNAILSNNTNMLLREFLGCRIVLFDDIHFLAGKEKTQEQLLTIIDACLASGIYVAVAGDRSAIKVAESGINKRLADRLGGGLSVAVMAGGPHLRFEALKKRIARADLKCKFTEEALDFIVRNFTHSMRETCGALTQLILLYGAKDVLVDLTLARTALRSRLQDGKPAQTLDDLLTVSAEILGVSIEDMRGRARPQKLARARHAFVYCAREILKESLPRIAAALSRDHTTALSSMRRAAALLERDKVFCKQVDQIREKMDI